MDIEHFGVLHSDCRMPDLINEGHAARLLHLSQESRCIFVFTNCTITILFSSFSLYIVQDCFIFPVFNWFISALSSQLRSFRIYIRVLCFLPPDLPLARISAVARVIAKVDAL